MEVFKFGGASVKDAQAVENVARLLRQYAPKQLVVVVSAMAKTTNALEKVLQAWMSGDGKAIAFVEESKQFHLAIADALFPDKTVPVFAKINHYFQQLSDYISQQPSGNFDYEYDQVVSFGELLSSTIIAEYLCAQGFDCQWEDVRRLLLTDATWREGTIDWEWTTNAIQDCAQKIFADSKQSKILLTQGFLGATPNGKTTTLGREGSDYTAAIFSYALDAEEMTVWKDVPGVLNADPKIFADTVLLPHISYGEAIELTYYGATVIHPKTIKPLENKKIPLRVRSFLHPEMPGTLITGASNSEKNTPSYIVKNNQLLVSIAPKDFSFIAENNLRDIFAAFAKAGIRINMMQNSAISFTACISQNDRKFELLLDLLGADFKIKYNGNLQLVTIRHWNPECIEEMSAGKNLLLEQRNRTTAQMVFNI